MALTHVLPADRAEAPALLRVRFGAPGFAARSGPQGLRLEIPVPCLAEEASEAWGAPPVDAWGEDAGEAWAASGHWLVSALSAPADGDLEAEALGLYRRLLARVAARSVHLYRVWNHVPRINEGAGDAERYRLFNAGRARALGEAWGAEAAVRYPAASAVGAEGNRLAMWALAGPLPGTVVENPRQVPAWAYPAAYGTRPPCFARALALPPEAGGAALISGTAAVLGHRTAHPGDTVAQLGVALDNLDAVRSALPGRFVPAARKVYLRRAEEARAVREALAADSPEVPVLALRADICRGTLTVEIEETARPV